MAWEREDVTRATEDAKGRVEDTRAVLARYDADAKRKLRLAMGLCACCYYLRGRIGGRSMTEYVCRGCGKTAMHGCTCVPVLCSACASQRGLCQHCGGQR
jgi:hypothetical protein